MFYACELGVKTIDASDTIMAIHQDGFHLQDNKPILIHNLNTVEINRNRFGLVNCWKTSKNIDDSSHKTLVKDGVITVLDKLN